MNRFIYILLLPFVFGACTSSKLTTDNKANEEGELSYDDQSRAIRMIFNGEKEELKGNGAKAISYYRECIDIDPESAVCYYKIASVYYSQGNFLSAANRMVEAIEIDDSNKWYYLLLTKCYLGLGESEKATDTFEKVIALEPDNLDFQLELVELYAQQGRFKEAIAILDEVEKSHGSSPEFNIRKQDFYMANGEPYKAIETCKSLIDQHPDQPNYYGILAILYESVGDKENEYASYMRLIELDSLNGLAHLKLSYIYQEQGNRAKAEEEMAAAFKDPELEIDIKIGVLTQYYEKLRMDTSYWSVTETLLQNLEESNPNDSRTYSVISDFLTQDERYAEARDYLLKAIEIQKDRFQVWNQLIILDSQLEDWEAMVAHSELALELFPSNPGLYYYQGIGFVQLQKYDDAIEILETGKIMIFKSESGLVDFYVLLGDSYNAIKDYKKSDENYDLALAANPNNPYVLNNFAYYLSLRKENLEKAETMAKKAVELEPNQYNYQDTYGWVLFQLGKYEEAAKWLEMAVNNGGSVNGEIIEHLGDALYKMGKEDEALLKWKEAKAVGDATELIDEKVNKGIYIE